MSEYLDTHLVKFLDFITGCILIYLFILAGITTLGILLPHDMTLNKIIMFRINIYEAVDLAIIAIISAIISCGTYIKLIMVKGHHYES